MKRLTPTPTVFVLAAGHNERPVVTRLFRLLSKQSYIPIKSVFVNDGSTDGTAETLGEQFPNVRVLCGDGTLWWTGAMHRGVAEIQRLAKTGDFILTINNDCTFNRSYVATLVQASLEHGRAVIGSLAVDRDDRTRIWDGGVKVDWTTGRFFGLGPHRTTKLPRGKAFRDDIDTLSTKGTLYPIEVFERAGNFAARELPHYGSDYELGLRAKRSGFALLLSYRARVANEVKRTGFAQALTGPITLGEFIRLMFGRRSQVNIVDHAQLIRLACPPRYRLANYLRALGKFGYYLVHVRPFTVLLKPAQALRRRWAVQSSS